MRVRHLRFPYREQIWGDGITRRVAAGYAEYPFQSFNTVPHP
ncbi:MAG: hypothetical protein PHV82_05165 [Victivallaceae bacterium]|nr:hypothetical protein [Victivallaceae bacterium]